MKSKVFALSVLLASAMTANAQVNTYTEKATDNIFLGIGVGGMSVVNDGFNTWTPNLNLQLGKYITPTWGVRAELSGVWQTLDRHAKSSVVGQDGQFHKRKKQFVELNMDAMLNVTNWLGGYNPDRVVDFYVFAGPTTNLASKYTAFTGESDAMGQSIVDYVDGTKLRFGATAGAGLGIKLNDKLALTAEGRFGVTPSIFGDASSCRKAESTFRANLGLVYTFGGKKFKKVEDRVIEREVIREVPKEVIREVVKEVKVVEGNAVAAAAVFFKINKTEISKEGLVNIKLIAEAIKKSPSSAKYMVSGNADKATGSAKRNQWLSEQRAQKVYDALVAEGVNPNQLEIKANGGVDAMWFDNDALSRVTVIQVK